MSRQRWVAVPTHRADVTLEVRRWWGGATWQAVHIPSGMRVYAAWRGDRPEVDRGAETLATLDARLARAQRVAA